MNFEKRKIKILLKWLYACAALICCYFTLKQLRRYSISLRYICMLLCVLSFVRMDMVEDKVRKVFDRPWKKLLEALLEIWGVFAMTGMYYFYNPFSTPIFTKRYPGLLYLILTCIWVRPLMRMILAFLIKGGENIAIGGHKTGNMIKIRLGLIGFMIVLCIPFLIAFNPAISSPDSRYCFHSAHALWDDGFSMLDWHPPFYVFIMSLFLKVCDSVSFLIVMQYIFFAIVFVDGIIFLYRCGFSKKLLGAFYFFIAFSVNHLIMLTTLWRDVPYMISIMWLTILLMKYVMRHEIYQGKWGWYVQFVIALVFTAFFRQNGILPAIAVIVILPIAMKFTKRIVISCIVCVMLMVSVKGPLYDFMNVIPAPQEKFVPLANDMMFSYYMGYPVSEDVMEVINKVTLGDPDNFLFNPYYVRVITDAEPSGYSVLEFMKIYGKNIIDNPRMMAAAVVLRSSAAWSIVRPWDEHATCANYLGEINYEEEGKYTYPLRRENELTRVLTSICTWINLNSILNPIYWRVGIYNLFILFTMTITFCCRVKRKLFYMLPFIPISTNVAGIIIASGWSDYRIYWPSMAVGLFLMFFFLHERRTQEQA